MPKRFLIDVTALLGIAPLLEDEAKTIYEMRQLADDLNDVLPDYECMLAHLELRDYFILTPLDDEMQAERKRRFEEVRDR